MADLAFAAAGQLLCGLRAAGQLLCRLRDVRMRFSASALAAAQKHTKLICTKSVLPQNCDFLQRNKKHGGLRDDELHFDRICFNFPHIGLGIKDQVHDVH